MVVYADRIGCEAQKTDTWWMGRSNDEVLVLEDYSHSVSDPGGVRVKTRTPAHSFSNHF